MASESKVEKLAAALQPAVDGIRLKAHQDARTGNFDLRGTHQQFGPMFKDAVRSVTGQRRRGYLSMSDLGDRYDEIFRKKEEPK